ncbi:hypothetical protein [Variovorax paradoxus]|uniref:Uncharacterized protein n=1 Tax=Variovorax paradoxus TaxID=34073 RepID=A0A0H2LY83_VARPD|nr:hypothetical protein [Variovorax paradoxus]KLN54741.1 hypothetical protein VPARA_40450 [Variovorax paradoxus]
MTIEFRFDQRTRAFIGPHDAEPSPLEPGKFLISAFATEIAPPVFTAGQMAYFRDDAWVVEDLPAPLPEPGAAPAPEPVEPTFEDRLKALQDVVQLQLDAVARVYGYDSIASAVSYAEEPAVPKFQLEGQALRAWRSRVWAACYELLGQVQREERDEPTADELLAALPAFEAPEAAE